MLRKPEMKLEITGGREVLRLSWRAGKSFCGVEEGREQELGVCLELFST